MARAVIGPHHRPRGRLGDVSVVDPGSSATAPSVCVGCGLCCDGTVLGHLAVADESDLGPPLLALGVEVIVEADPPVFALPCPAVVDGACAVHELHRPHACHQFQCTLAQAVASGSVSVDRARSVIAETVAIRDRVAAGLEQADVLDRQLEVWFRGA
jgi:hypothetical protein